MHPSEWIDQAKAVPLGQHRRVVHGAETTAAMSVYNAPEYWAAYCHRCKESAKVYKQFAAKPIEEAVIHRKYFSKADCIPVNKMQDYDYAEMIKMLHTKGMSMFLLEPFKPVYNKLDKRLVFNFDGVDIGRDITGRNGAKWLVYHRDQGKGYVYLQPKKSFPTRELVLTEDLFSAIKVNHYSGKACMCLLGTNFNDEKFNFIIKNNFVPVLATDGDKAGWDARDTIKRRLELFGIDYRVAAIPDGLDPKDLNHLQIQEIFNA